MPHRVSYIYTLIDKNELHEKFFAVQPNSLVTTTIIRGKSGHLRPLYTEIHIFSIQYTKVVSDFFSLKV